MFLHRDVAFSKRVADESGLNVILATGVYTYDHLPQALAQPHRGRDRRDLRPRDRERDPGDRHQGGLHQVRRRRAGRHAERREDPPRRRARLDADRPADHGPLATRERHRPRADAGLHRGGRRPGEGPDRPHRATPTTSTTSSACSTPAAGSAWTATASTSSCRPSSARRPCSRCSRRATRTACSCPRTGARRSTGSPPEVEEQLSRTAAPNWCMTFLFEEVIPELKERGMTDEQLDQMMVENPKRWLA